MNVTLAVAPTLEPITLLGLKASLRLDSGTLADNLAEVQNLIPAQYAIAADYVTHVGAAVEVLGYHTVVVLNSGANGAGGTVDCKIQESDDGAAWADWSGGAFNQVTEANDNAIQEKQYTGTKRYIRTVAQVLAAACTFGTTIILYTPTSSEDDYLEDFCITPAREHVEDITRRAILTQTWDYYIDDFPSKNSFKIPFGNLQSVTHIKYTESDGTETTMVEGTDYIVETNGEACGRIVLPYGYAWPATTLNTSNPIVVRFVCGWASVAAVPTRIKTACALIAADFYENREAQQFGVSGSGYVQNEAVMRLLAPLRLWDEFV